MTASEIVKMLTTSAVKMPFPFQFIFGTGTQKSPMDHIDELNSLDPERCSNFKSVISEHNVMD